MKRRMARSIQRCLAGRGGGHLADGEKDKINTVWYTCCQKRNRAMRNLIALF